MPNRDEGPKETIKFVYGGMNQDENLLGDPITFTFTVRSDTQATIQDGTSNTILFGEKYGCLDAGGADYSGTHSLYQDVFIPANAPLPADDGLLLI